MRQGETAPKGGWIGNATGGVKAPEPILLPDPAIRFARTAERLALLSQGHPMEGWLDFMAKLARAQHRVATTLAPLITPDEATVEQAVAARIPPIAADGHRREAAWRDCLALLLDSAAGEGLPTQAAAVAMELRARILPLLRDVPFIATAEAEIRMRPSNAVLLDDAGLASDESLGDVLVQVLPELVPPQWARRGPTALAALGVRRIQLGTLIDELATVDREPSWWRSLYDALANAGVSTGVLAGLRSLLVVLPLAGLLFTASPAELLPGLGDPLVGPAAVVSLVTTSVSLALVVLCGTPLAWLIARRPSKEPTGVPAVAAGTD